MDITETTAPKSDQQSFEDFPLGITRVVTVTAVNRNGDEQPVNVELAEYPGRPFRPNLSMRRVLRDVWGRDTSTYVGKRLELFGNPDVMWGGKKVGGVQIKAMSHIDGPKSVQLTVTRGTRGKFTVQPLADTPTPDLTPILAAIHTAPGLPELQAAWQRAIDAKVAGHPDVLAAKDARKGELNA